MRLDGDLLRTIAGGLSGRAEAGRAAVIDAIGPILRDTLLAHEINTALRAAHFLAQICHESDGFRTTTEFAGGDAYEGRADLGNTEPGDGRRYKGRGLILLTGRANYRVYSELLGLDLVGSPDLAADPQTALLIAATYWAKHGLNAVADKDDIQTITRRINGGLNGLDSRLAYLERAKTALSAT